MEKVKIEEHGNVALLRLDNKVSNAISATLVENLSDVVNRIKGNCRGLVLAGGEKFFSMGFNLPELLKLNRSGMTEFFYRFNQVVLDIFTLSMPTACAITGHAIAGGTILASSCDYRFLASGRKLMGLNEIKIGVPVPYLSDLMLRQIAGDRAATAMVYRGEFIEPLQAEKIGLVDEVVSCDQVENRALQKISQISALPPDAFAAIKANRVESIRLAYEKNGKVKNEIFLECWFSKSAQELLSKAAEKF
ncbi:MAG: enoyl-CoA hydratase/isomerase family protein [Desulfobacterales bacterium]|nr:enoyl-CoA hydratase/isomerase family protein [Deltaproteobacteria bacterium]NNL42436.1 enoyl-CoA hydratase/isomerase family protein [Desulfobacterales bacterium]NNL74734.1 enoyl-CoA hydratase/isomerase family protein [Desulfobacterales bacterium]